MTFTLFFLQCATIHPTLPRAVALLRKDGDLLTEGPELRGFVCSSLKILVAQYRKARVNHDGSEHWGQDH